MNLHFGCRKQKNKPKSMYLTLFGECIISFLVYFVVAAVVVVFHETSFIFCHTLNSHKSFEDKLQQIEKWRTEKGVLIMGYAMFRNLVDDVFQTDGMSYEQMKMEQMLIDPGPDLIICDEGHLLKNDKTSLSENLSSIRTHRKIVLTGTPMQNNLEEYFCMVDFVKPHLLGTHKEFKNRFVNPITNGQYLNSNDQDILLMKRRSYILHNLLDGCIHRANMSILAPFILPKNEYVIYIRLTTLQVTLYKVMYKTFAAKLNQFDALKNYSFSYAPLCSTI